MKKSDKNSMNIYNTRWLSILSLIGIVCFMLYPRAPLFGVWEGSVFIHSFLPYEMNLDFRIHPRANIGGYQYAVLDVARYVVQWIGLSINKFRFPAVIWGALCFLPIYYLFTAKDDYRLRIFSVLFLLTNALFLSLEQQSVVLVFSFLCFLCEFLYFYRVLIYGRRVDIIFFGIFTSMALMHYGPGRYYALMFIFLLPLARMVVSYQSSKKVMPLRIVGDVLLNLFTICCVLFVFDYRNLGIISNFRTFLAPDGSEGATSLPNLVRALPFNINIMKCSLLGCELNKYFSPNSLYTLAWERYQLAPVLWFPLLLIGVYHSLRGRYKLLGVLSAGLLAITLLIPLASIVIDYRGQVIPTLHFGRYFFAIGPISILCALGLHAVWTHRKVTNHIRTALLAMLCVVWALPAYNYFKDVSDFNKLITNYNCFRKMNSQEYFTTCGVSDRVKLTGGADSLLLLAQDGEHSVFNEHTAYYKTAVDFKNKIDKESFKNIDLVIIKEFIWPLPPVPFVGHYTYYNHLQLFLSAYLSSLGLPVGIVQFYDEDMILRDSYVPPRERGIKGVFKYIRNIASVRTNRTFPLEVDYKTKSYKPPKGRLVPRELFSSLDKRSERKFFLATTNMELEYIIRKATEVGMSYSIVTLD